MSEQQPESSISRPPTRGEIFFDRLFRHFTLRLAIFTIALVLLIVGGIAYRAGPVMRDYGFSLLVSDKWDSGQKAFGILPEIWGTIYSSILGVALGAVLGVAVAIFLTQDYISPLPAAFIKNVVELLAAIPSVVYGLWGIFVLIPAIRPGCEWLHHNLGWFPLFSTRLSGPGLLPASLVLAIMVLPTITAICAMLLPLCLRSCGRRPLAWGRRAGKPFAS